MPRGTAKSNADLARGRKRASRGEDYASDDGFVANGSDADDVPKSKKPKTTVTKSKPPQAKKSGEEFWELSGKRRATVSEFKGMQMINIREYWEKDGELLPGKKGISLTVEQYNNLMLALPSIEAALTANGEKIRRPDFKGKPMPAVSVEDADQDEEDKAPERRTGEESKRNFEATSDED